MPKRVYNFSPGPCTLPYEVLEETQSEITNYKNSGMSLIEDSHRGKNFVEVHTEAVDLIRELLQIPEDFSILLVQGGATLQFAMTALNALAKTQKAGFVLSGHWAKLAWRDTKLYGNVYSTWDGVEENYTRMPGADELNIEDDTRYLHVTTNETIGGVRLHDWPDVSVPLVCDMSSDYFSRSIPWELVDIAYGGAQKNLGPSGVALVIVRNTVLESSPRELPKYLDYRVHAKSSSLFNTPPVFSIYVSGKVLKYYKRNGGVEQYRKISIEKSNHLYNAIDRSGGFYDCPISGASRSRMNVVFRVATEELQAKFLAQAENEGFVNLKGHRSVGGMRASLYNSMPMEGAQKLAEFMDYFRAANS